jgi:tetratricopeptide (TPR) repeat protein
MGEIRRRGLGVTAERAVTRRAGLAILTLLAVVVILPIVAVDGAAAAAPAKPPRAVVVVPFDASTLPREEQWLGEGLAQLVSLGLTQHPGVVVIDRARLRALRQPDVGTEAAGQLARSAHADAALFGRVTRASGNIVIQPLVIEVKGGSGDSASAEPITTSDADLLARAAALPVVFARAAKVQVSEAEAARMERAARPTKSLRALELYARGEAAASKGGQESNETAVDLLSRAIEVDPNLVVAHHALGMIHQNLGNRWKAAAQFRAATQLDASYPEPYKALGDLFLAAPRRLFDQAVEAYTKAIELRPFYADAHVGLGDARAAKGDVDGAVKAYQAALVHNPLNPKVHMSLGKIYYAEKGLYYESVSAYKKAIELDPSSVDARMGLGEVYEDKGLYKEAMAEYKQVVELDGKHTGAMYNLALVYEKVDPKEAIAQWERYIALASQLPSEKDWVDVARQHLRKLKNTVKD